MLELDLDRTNASLRFKSPQEIIKWAIDLAKKPILTTNFGPYSASLIHAVNKVDKGIDVIWCDTGYNTSSTYKYAKGLIESLDLKMNVYVPKQTTAYRDAVFGIPTIEDPRHLEFTEQVKLEPFRRAIAEHQPDVWFTNLRKGQTKFRDSLDIVTFDKNGVLKVSPFYYWSDQQIEDYLSQNNLPNELRYFDPTKVQNNRECGLHL